MFPTACRHQTVGGRRWRLRLLPAEVVEVAGGLRFGRSQEDRSQCVVIGEQLEVRRFSRPFIPPPRACLVGRSRHTLRPLMRVSCVHASSRLAGSLGDVYAARAPPSLVARRAYASSLMPGRRLSLSVPVSLLAPPLGAACFAVPTRSFAFFSVRPCVCVRVRVWIPAHTL